MFDTFKEQVEKGTEVQLWLITGKEVTGTVAEIGDTYVIINTKQGQVTVFEKLLGGWEIKTLEEKPAEEPQDIPDSISISGLDEMLSDFKKKLTLAKLNPKPPDFSFPSRSLLVESHIKNGIKKEWDKISSQFQYYLKIKNLTSVPQLAHELRRLGEKYPKTGAFYYNAGCFMSTFGKCSEAINYFEKAFDSEKLPQYIYNVACSALEIKDCKIR